MKATSWLERLPHAQASASSAASKAQRIVDSQGELGVAEVLRSIHVVEEVVEPAPRHRRPALAEVPGQGGGEPRRDGEEALVRQLRMVLEVAPDVHEREPRSEREGDRIAEAEVAPERRAAAQLGEALLDRRDA